MSNDAIQKVNPEFELPAFMRNDDAVGTDALKEFVIPSRIKIIQKSAADELLENFDVGDVIIVPTCDMIAKLPVNDQGKPSGEKGRFTIVPIFFFPEWISWNPIEVREQESAIRYRTTDRNDPVVKKARTPGLRQEPHPIMKDKMISHNEHLNFLCMVESDTFVTEEPVILGFSRTSHACGSKLSQLIRMRKAPIYGCRFDILVFKDGNAKGSWYNFEVANPADGSAFVTDEETYKLYAAMHAEFEALHKDSLIQAQYDDEITTAGDASAEF